MSFVCETHQESIPIELLKGYFSRNGFLLCNECRNMPSLFNVGGDWNSIVELIEEGQVFYSKLYKGRVTYLSREFYAQVKPYRQRMELISSHSRLIYNLLDTIGYANAQDIKRLLNLSNKVYTDAMHELSQELLITAIQRDKTINQNWSSFYWGTYKTWESLHPISDIEVSTSRLKQLLDRLISEKEIHKLLQ